jgi:tetratricopeptide (TPR) repeat protein
MELFAEAWIRAAPGEVRAYEDLATALIRSHQPEKAVGAGKKLIQLRKLNYEGYYFVGQAHNLMGEQEAAQKYLETARIYVPREFRWHVLVELYETYEALGQIDNAIATLEEVIPLVDQIQQVYYQPKLTRLKEIRDKLSDNIQLD